MPSSATCVTSPTDCCTFELKRRNRELLHFNTHAINGLIIKNKSDNCQFTTNMTAIKPTASISKSQKTVNVKTMEETTLELVGRHDPCIVHRVIHVINAITSYAILEIIARNEGLNWIK